MNAQILAGHRFQFISFCPVRYASAPGISHLHINDDSHLLHIIHGRATIFVEDRQDELRPGMAASIPPFTRFYFDIRTPFEMLNIHYKVWLADGVPMEDCAALPLFFRPAGFRALVKFLRGMQKIRAARPPASLILAAHAHEIILRHCMTEPSGPARRAAPDARLAPACRRLSDPDYGVYHAGEIARLCGLSESQLNRLFQKCFQMPPRRFWEKRRFAAACFMLRATDQPVKQVAMECRFDDEAYFSRWFKKMAGCAPAAFRRGAAQQWM